MVCDDFSAAHDFKARVNQGIDQTPGHPSSRILEYMVKGIERTTVNIRGKKFTPISFVMPI